MSKTDLLLPSEDSRIGIWLTASAVVFVVAWFVVGDLFGVQRVGRCPAFFGCNSGFFGYDAFIHLLGGIAITTFIVWLGKNYSRFNVISGNFWKSTVIIVALCVLLENGWEMWEFGIDHFRTDVLHQDIINTGQILQPSNADTMGDETFNLLGSIIAIALLASFERNLLIGSEK